MKYHSSFYSLHKNNPYSVEIITNNLATPTVEITLGPSPFTTTMDESADTIYSPIKYQNATIQVVANTYHDDFYSSTAKQNLVKLTDTSTGDVKFIGYTRPNTLSAPYDEETETYNVEVLDGLSILQYYNYTAINGTKDFVTFADIINHCLETAGCYTKWYFSANTHIENKTGCIVEQYTISEQNFFDEDDEPMKMDEVLTEICQYCSVTAIAHGESVYFIDYDAIAAGIDDYYEFTVGGSGSSTTLSDEHEITAEDYADTGSTLDYCQTYSKVTVRDSLYDVKEILPPMFENEDLRSTQYVSEDDQKWDYTYSTSCWDGGDKDSEKKYFSIRTRCYTNNRYNHYFYDNNGSTATGPIYNMLTAENYLGAEFFKYNIGKGDTFTSAYNDLKYEFENYFIIPINHNFFTGKKLLETKQEFVKPFFVSSNAKFIVSGSAIFTDRGTFKNGSGGTANIGYFPDDGTIQGERGESWSLFGNDKLSIKKKNLATRIVLNLGTHSKEFDIPFHEEGKGEEELREGRIIILGIPGKDYNELFYHSFDVMNNVHDYAMGIDEDGYLLDMNLTANTVIAAKPIISFYGMDKYVQEIKRLLEAMGLPTDKGYNPTACVFLKDFDIKAVMPHQSGKDENDTDTEYSYEINSDYVSELSDIEFKICTWDNKQLNYSAVAYRDGTDYKFVDKITNAALSSIGAIRPEESLCHRIVNQYSDPAKKLTLHLFDNLLPYTLVEETNINCSMIVDSISHDYINDNAEYILIEKK